MSTVKSRTSAQYHERVQRTRELAWRTGSGPVKTMFMRMAADYDGLAALAERREQQAKAKKPEKN
jgi:hypothetical protein